MFYYISGKTAHVGLDFVVIDAGGVGYKIFTSESTLKRVETDQPAKLYTYLHVREDLMDLYGFLTAEELGTFQMLISVSGVGPKVALALLSTIPPSEFALAVVTGNIKAITRAPGVGPKVAQRIVLELKDKLKNEQLIAQAAEVEDMAGELDEAVSALIVLGYSQTEAKRAVAAADPSDSVEETVKQALKKLMK